MATPTPYDVGWFTDADQLGNKQGLGARDDAKLRQATQLIADFRKRGGAGVFKRLDRQSIADGLSLRLTSPDSFNQGDTWLCGIATFVRIWAHDHSPEYVQLAIDLFEKGEGYMTAHPKYGDKLIRPSSALKDSPPAFLSDGKTPMNQADWIVLASIREAFNDVFDYTSNEGIFRIKAWNFPMDVVREFRAAGYTRVVNEANGLRPSGYDNLMKASDLYDDDWRVILLINSRLLSQTDLGAPAISTSNHWVGLNGDINVSTFNDKPSIFPVEVYSWDGLYSIPRWKKPLPLRTFIDSYFGYVAGRF